ncbi:MAG: D-alanyl-D-alanine carboxypeptidase family protein [Christensenellales bacterium]
MNKIIAYIAALIMVFTAVFTYNTVESKAENISISAKSAVLIEASTGRLLYEKNAFEKMPMASTTKIMTAIVALEHGSVKDTVVAGKNASGVEGSSIWLSEGERMSLSDMLFGLMLASGNDAAVAIAEHIGGSVEGFVGMMNQTAQKIGAYNTHFANPNGLPAKDHYTTAYDLALISAYAMNNKYFCEIVKTQYKTLPWEGHEWNRVVKNKNKILWNYEGGNGIKTGYTKAAGRCLAAAAERDGMQLIAVALDAPDMFDDCMAILNRGFDNYKNRLLVEKDKPAGSVAVKNGMLDSFDVYPQKDVYFPLTDEEYEKIEKRVIMEETVRAPVYTGQRAGYIDVYLERRKICSVPLCSAVSIKDNSYQFNLLRLLDFWLNTRVLKF